MQSYIKSGNYNSLIKYTDQIDLIQINTQVNEKSEQREIIQLKFHDDIRVNGK
jgi:hypothetical protein